MKQFFKYLLICIISFCFTIIVILSRSHSYYFKTNDFQNYDNLKPFHYPIIPNIIHFIIFDKSVLEFSVYLSLLSCLKFQNPDNIYLHTNGINFTGANWEKLLKLNKTHPIITINDISKPTHVYGQRISSTFHASDVARIQILKKWGGIYLDTDTVILKNLDKFRKYEMVIGWPKNEYMGTQILLAHKNARFLNAWMDGYKRYVPSNWYYNAGQYPTEQILEKMPYLAHRVPELFGVQNLLEQLYKPLNWTEWKQYYAIHLLSRHKPAPVFLNETLIHEMEDSAFKKIAQYILYT